jgi:hypothetical protein
MGRGLLQRVLVKLKWPHDAAIPSVPGPSDPRRALLFVRRLLGVGETLLLP